MDKTVVIIALDHRSRLDAFEAGEILLPREICSFIFSNGLEVLFSILKVLHYFTE